jgi:endonuclease/exonuclease/phosphatase family metal-dependent hydrolase
VARLPDGAEVSVESRSEDRRWYRVRAAGSDGGWVTRRYLDLGGDAGAFPPASSARRPAALAEASPWASPESCARAVAAGERDERTPGSARVATWNLRWFPDGMPGKKPNPNGGLDLEWLSCAITWLDVDVVVLQEIKAHARARSAMDTVARALERKTGHRWLVELDRCPIEVGQHVGFLYDSQRVRAAAFRTHASLNPHGEPCKDQLRPGFGGYFRFQGGFDAHLIAVHLKSGGERRAYELREKSLRGMAAALREAGALEPDGDVLLIGDLNTMGCPECSPPFGPADELERMERTLGALPVPVRRVEADGSCSQYFHGRGVLLDHFLATPTLRELPADGRASVAGYCAETACRALPAAALPSALERLSDHCPLVLELSDRDLD